MQLFILGVNLEVELHDYLRIIIIIHLLQVALRIQLLVVKYHCCNHLKTPLVA